MAEFTINEMLEMQKTLQERYKDKWQTLSPAAANNQLLWMICEIGEVIDIVKKHGGEKACHDADLRNHLVEELTDVLMYYNDILLCYGITSDELKKAYQEKHRKNMNRW
ncbi:MAG: nucleotide pyrophosphohydrolase [Oscillospiraceae bacterium]|nr:nucleotide pyrophosphohydrolase [Oscillospiraceae bacterium]